MEETKSIMLGIDLADDYTQVSYYTQNNELFSVSLSKDPMKYRIPTMLCAFSDGTDWLFGEDAAYTAQNDSCAKITGLVRTALDNSCVDVFGQSFPADILLERFFRRLLAAVKAKLGEVKIKRIVITSKTVNDNLKRNAGSALELLGIRGDSLRVLTHLESFMYYVVSQNRDIWINDVGLFDFDSEGAVFYRLSFGRRNTPLTIVADKTDLSDKITMAMLAEDEIDRLRYVFESTATVILHKQLISALYFTGQGYESAWADDILKKLCNGRRIFRGQNLYVKGAGYAAGLIESGEDSSFFFVNDEVLKSSISVRAFSDGAYREIMLADAGQPCCGAGAEIEVIMDHTNELDFIVHNVLKKDFVCAIMTLDTLNLRNDRSVRLNIRLAFPDRNTCVITVRDVGFGQIYRTTYKIWEQVLRI